MLFGFSHGPLHQKKLTQAEIGLAVLFVDAFGIVCFRLLMQGSLDQFNKIKGNNGPRDSFKSTALN